MRPRAFAAALLLATTCLARADEPPAACPFNAGDLPTVTNPGGPHGTQIPIDHILVLMHRPQDRRQGPAGQLGFRQAEDPYRRRVRVQNGPVRGVVHDTRRHGLEQRPAPLIRRGRAARDKLLDHRAPGGRCVLTRDRDLCTPHER